MTEIRKESNLEVLDAFPLAFGLAFVVMYLVLATEFASRQKPFALPSAP